MAVCSVLSTLTSELSISAVFYYLCKLLHDKSNYEEKETSLPFTL